MTFLEHFQNLPFIQPDRTDLEFIKRLEETFSEVANGAKVLVHQWHARGSGATTILKEWVKFTKPDGLFVIGCDSWAKVPGVLWHKNSWQSHIRGMMIDGQRPKFCILDDPFSHFGSVVMEARFRQFLSAFPYSGFHCRWKVV